MESVPNKTVTIALVQMSMGTDSASNLAKACAKVKEAAQRGANIVCLPELFPYLYFPQEEDNKRWFNIAESIPGPTSEKLSVLAKENKIVLVGGSIFEKSGKKYYNTSVVFNPDGKIVGKYRKLHIPHDPLFYEQHYFAPGDKGYCVCQTAYGKIAVLICYDQWFPEAARSVTLQGAEIIFYPTAIGWIKGVKPEEGDWHDAWETVQRGHAIANGVYVAAVNRVGSEGKLHFWGGSFISGPFGTVLARGNDQEQLVIAKCDITKGKNVQEAWCFLHNRRPELYKGLIK